MRLDQREIARYLGAAGKPLWPEAAAWARDCQRELEGTVTPVCWGGGCPFLCLPGRAGIWTGTCATVPRAFCSR
ncbi:MAG: hypothetical protein ACLSCQ_02455 [Evtepia gabavorous]